MVKNKIINLGDPTDATDAVNKQYLEKSHVKPSYYNNEFKYLMTNRLAWTDLQADSFDITKIDNLMPQDGNYHQYNHKVLYTTIIKDQQGGYSDTFYSLDLYVNIPQSGIDLNTYPKNWIKNWMIAYGVFGKVPSIDPQKTYDYHTAFDIRPTEVVYNVNLDMNRKKILNIAPDKTKNNSAATVKMVKELETKLSPHTTNNAYREILRNFMISVMLASIK